MNATASDTDCDKLVLEKARVFLRARLWAQDFLKQNSFQRQVYQRQSAYFLHAHHFHTPMEIFTPYSCLHKANGEISNMQFAK